MNKKIFINVDTSVDAGGYILHFASGQEVIVGDYLPSAVADMLVREGKAHYYSCKGGDSD